MREPIQDCVDHLNGPGQCEACGLEVDAYGNTENEFRYCAFPDCGCDGERLCMAKEGASDDAKRCNVEGMWSGTSIKAKTAIAETMNLVLREPK